MRLLGMIGVTAFTLALGLPGVAAGAAPAGDQAVESGRRALAQRGSYPWYDAEHDAVRRLDVAPPKSSAEHRNSKWESQPMATPTLSPWRFLGEVLRWLVWALLLLVLVGLVILLIRAFLGYEGRQASVPGLSAEELARDHGVRIENLPFPVPKTQTDLLAEARRLYEAGRFGEAVVYLYSYQLLELDKHHVIRLTRGKTNRQYLREAGTRADLGDTLKATMVAFEDVFFGHHELDRSGFEACWSRLDDFHQRVREVAAV
jgi:hypothetical protein